MRYHDWRRYRQLLVVGEDVILGVCCALKKMTISSEYEMNWTGPSTELCGTMHETRIDIDG